MVDFVGNKKSGPVFPGPLGVWSGLTLRQPLGRTLLSPVAVSQQQQQQGLHMSIWAAGSITPFLPAFARESTAKPMRVKLCSPRGFVNESASSLQSGCDGGLAAPAQEAGRVDLPPRRRPNWLARGNGRILRDGAPRGAGDTREVLR